jgi:hypothetical protein
MVMDRAITLNAAVTIGTTRFINRNFHFAQSTSVVHTVVTLYCGTYTDVTPILKKEAACSSENFDHQLKNINALTFGNFTGDPKYGVPILEPLQIEQLSVTQGSTNVGLSFTATNLNISGIKNLQVKDIR